MKSRVYELKDGELKINRLATEVSATRPSVHARRAGIKS